MVPQEVEEEGHPPKKKNKTSMAGNISNTTAPITSSLSKLQSLNGLFAIYKKQGPTSADVLNTLKEALLKGNAGAPSGDEAMCRLVRLRFDSSALKLLFFQRLVCRTQTRERGGSRV